MEQAKYPCAYLNETHTKGMRGVLQYFEKNQAPRMQEIRNIFSEAKDMRLLEDMYHVNDVRDIVDSIDKMVNSTVQSELKRMQDQCILYIRQLLLQAEGNSITLSVDAKVLDNDKMLAGVKNESFLPGKKLPLAKRKGSLASLGASPVDVKLVRQIKDKEAEHQKTKGKLRESQEQVRRIQSVNTELKASVEELGAKLEAVESNMSASEGQSASQTARLQAENKELRLSIKEAQKELSGKLSASKQFQQLKKMLTKKNEQIRNYRTQLKEFQPENTDDSALRIP